MLVVLIAGALGSGKTTLLLSLAMRFRQEGRRVGILENDAGTVPVDAPFLRSRGFAVEDIRSGCICCDLSSALPGAVSAIKESSDPEVILVEPSGLAAPGIVRGMLKEILSGDDRFIALYLVDLIRYSFAGRPLSPFFIKAIETSDLVVTTKSSSVDPEIITDFHCELGRNFPGKRIEDFPIISQWSYDDISDLQHLSRERRGSIQFQSPPAQDMQRFASSYQLRWRKGIEGETACLRLTDAISKIRYGINIDDVSRIGTVKMSTPTGGGTIISVSDSLSDPTVNRRSSWAEPPELIAVNVLAQPGDFALKDIVHRAFSGIDDLSDMEAE